MSNIVLFLILFLFIIHSSYSQTQCSPVFNFNNNDNACTYRVTYNNPTQCFEPTLASCDVMVLNLHLVTFNTKETCDSYCCSSLQADNVLCKKNSSMTSMTTIIIVLSTALAVFTLIACICKFKQYCCWEGCFSLDCLSRNNSVSNNIPQQNIQICNTNETQLDINNLEEREWYQDEEQDLGSLECSVCLGENSNFMLPCKHLFHKKCILECMKRKFECILCRRSDLFSYRIYCSHCFRWYKKVMYYDLSRLREEQNMTCEECMGKVLNPQLTE